MLPNGKKTQTNCNPEKPFLHIVKLSALLSENSHSEKADYAESFQW